MTQNNSRTKQPINSTKSSSSSKCKIAIIGASYAGLTLGNILHKHDISFVIFESYPNYCNTVTKKREGGSGEEEELMIELKHNLFVIGRFILPSFNNIIQKLGIPLLNVTGSNKEDRNTLDHMNDNALEENSCYERCNVILTLLYNIQPRIHYETTITSIIKCHDDNGSKSFYFISKDGSRYGPFEYIIGADGVHSILNSRRRSEMVMDDSNQIFLIGDARWVNNSWYDFGYYRIREGGNTAINDGFELGLILKNMIKMNGRENDSILGNDLDDLQDDAYQIELVKQKFSAKHNAIIRRNKAIICRVAIVVLIIAFIVQELI